MEDTNIIQLNVGGKLISTSKSVLMGSGYFKGLLEIGTSEIFIDFDPKIFRHVLSFLRDPLYKFNNKYLFALDFFDIYYEKNNLYEKIVVKCGRCDKMIVSFNNKTNKCVSCLDCTCIMNNCNLMKLRVSGAQYCQTHGCRYCNKLVISDSGCCIDHKCSIKSCSNCKQIDKKHCDIHNCNYFLCKNMVCDGKKYCVEHICEKSDCNNDKRKNTSFCGEHLCQYSDDCIKLSTDYKYCGKHKCKSHRCDSAISNDNSEFCISHKCNLCKNHRLDKKIYCADHNCSVNNCHEYKIDNSDFCVSHNCMKESCSLQSQNDKKYCKFHCCNYELCIECVHNCYEYCEKHLVKNNDIIDICIVELCNKIKRFGCEYCSQHKCSYIDCFDKKSNSKYCLKHTF